MIYRTRQKNHKRSVLELWNPTIHWSGDVQEYGSTLVQKWKGNPWLCPCNDNSDMSKSGCDDDDVRWRYRQNNDCIWHNFVLYITILLSNLGYISMLGASSMATKGRVGRTLRPRAKPKIECRSNIPIYMPYIPGKLFCRACCGTP